MAIGPKQLDCNFVKEVEGFEMIIDIELLKKSLSPGGCVTINTPRGITSQHFEVLVNNYVKAGWQNVLRDFGDQRDPGDWLIFQS